MSILSGAECGDAPDGCASGICDTTQDPAICLESDVCGNGVVETGEVCDDGNVDNGDGCSELCLLEAGAECGNAPDGCASGICDTTQDPAICLESDVCGNGVVETGEMCDDGNTDNTDGCTNECILHNCATNGYVYFDADKNDLYDDTIDVAISGVTIDLSNGMTTTTDADGYYEFINHACEEMTVTYVNDTGFAKSSAQLEQSTQQDDPMVIIVGQENYDLVSDNDNFGLISVSSGSGGSGSGGNANSANTAPVPVTPTPVVPTPLPEAEDIVSVELPEVESTPVTEVVEVEEPELVLAPEEQEMLENAKLNVYINNLQRSIDIPDTVIESVLKGDTDALITYLIENDHAYSVGANGLPTLILGEEGASHASAGNAALELPMFLPETGASL